MRPYISIVATSRNDNHGGDLLRRTSAFVRSVYCQSRKWGVPVELLLVDWNPPSDRPPLSEVLPRPGAGTPVAVKHITVPTEVHNRYRTSSVIPLYQMIAKNVGIRRATGDFILCTNIDILFSDACFRMFAGRGLEAGVFYRANRCDIPASVLDLDDHGKQLAFASRHVLKRLGKSPGHETLTLPRSVYWFPNLSRLLNSAVLGLWRATHPGKFAHFTIDFEACGDFTLMSRQDWMDIEGYAELDMYSIHIDSMALWAAAALGKRQVLFPYDACVYHVYHEDGWESHDPIRTIRFLESKPSLDYSIVFKGGMQIVEAGRNWGLNTPDWGLADVHLPTTTFGGE